MPSGQFIAQLIDEFHSDRSAILYSKQWYAVALAYAGNWRL